MVSFYDPIVPSLCQGLFYDHNTSLIKEPCILESIGHENPVVTNHVAYVTLTWAIMLKRKLSTKLCLLGCVSTVDVLAPSDIVLVSLKVSECSQGLSIPFIYSCGPFPLPLQSHPHHLQALPSDLLVTNWGTDLNEYAWTRCFQGRILKMLLVKQEVLESSQRVPWWINC